MQAAQDEEREALCAIYGEDCVVEQERPLRVALHMPLETTGAGQPISVTLTFSCPADYPEGHGPTIDARFDRATAFIQTQLYAVLAEEARANLGTPMLFTLAQKAKEWLEDSFAGRVAPPAPVPGAATAKAAPPSGPAAVIAAASCSTDDASESAAAAQRGGTPVTRESFAVWWKGFQERQQSARQHAELLLQQSRAEYDRRAAMLARPTGRQMFETDRTLATSDAGYDASFAPALAPTPPAVPVPVAIPITVNAEAAAVAEADREEESDTQ